MTLSRRNFLKTAAAFAATPLVSGTGRADVKVRVSGANATYTVSFTPAGGREEYHFGVYTTGDEASRVATALQRAGNAVRVRVTTAPIPVEAAPADTAPALARPDHIGYDSAVKVFKWLAGMSDIAFAFPADGCYARAHLMAKRMREQKLNPGKIWSLCNGERLRAATANDPRREVRWAWHVAPTQNVEYKGRVFTMVFDPSLFAAPATVSEWMTVQKASELSPNPLIRFTRLGEAPVLWDGRRAPGSGYTIGSDPADIDASAASTMREYKKYENRLPPAALL